jgi:hypothetical protein
VILRIIGPGGPYLVKKEVKSADLKEIRPLVTAKSKNSTNL